MALPRCLFYSGYACRERERGCDESSNRRDAFASRPAGRAGRRAEEVGADTFPDRDIGARADALPDDDDELLLHSPAIPAVRLLAWPVGPRRRRRQEVGGRQGRYGPRWLRDPGELDGRPKRPG